MDMKILEITITFKNLIWILTKFSMKKDIKQFIFMYFSKI